MPSGADVLRQGRLLRGDKEQAPPSSEEELLPGALPSRRKRGRQERVNRETLQLLG